MSKGLCLDQVEREGSILDTPTLWPIFLTLLHVLLYNIGHHGDDFQD